MPYLTQNRLLSSCLLACPACLPACLRVCMSVCLPACLSVSRSVCLSVCLPVCLSTCLPACLSVCRLVCLSVCLSFYLSTCLPVFQFVGWSVGRSVCLPACLCRFARFFGALFLTQTRASLYRLPICTLSESQLTIGQTWKKAHNKSTALCEEVWTRTFLFHAWNRAVSMGQGVQDCLPKITNPYKVTIWPKQIFRRKINYHKVLAILSSIFGNKCAPHLQSRLHSRKTEDHTDPNWRNIPDNVGLT